MSIYESCPPTPKCEYARAILSHPAVLRPRIALFTYFAPAAVTATAAEKEKRPQASPWRPQRTTEAAVGGARHFRGISQSVSESAAGAKGAEVNGETLTPTPWAPSWVAERIRCSRPHPKRSDLNLQQLFEPIIYMFWFRGHRNKWNCFIFGRLSVIIWVVWQICLKNILAICNVLIRWSHMVVCWY
jgi:hypothetical protein